MAIIINTIVLNECNVSTNYCHYSSYKRVMPLPYYILRVDYIETISKICNKDTEELYTYISKTIIYTYKLCKKI